MVVRPKRIKIGPYVYTVLWSKASWKKYLGDDYKTNVGKTRALSCQIFINAWNMALTQQQDTLVHEILHASFSVFGWSDDEYGWPTDDRAKVEEHIIRMLTPTLLGVFKDNPDLLEWLRTDEDE